MSHATRRQKRASLVRRRDFLAKRKVGRNDASSAFDRSELVALNWALQIIDAAEQENVLYELEQVVVTNEGRGT